MALVSELKLPGFLNSAAPVKYAQVQESKINLSINHSMESDLDIIRNIQNGDSNSFAELVSRYKDKAFSLAIKILKNEDDAEDCLQDAFIKLFRSIKQNQFEERSKFSTYFYSIVYNTAIDHYKKLKSKTLSLISIDVNDDNFRDGDELHAAYESKIDKALYEEGMGTDTAKQLTANEVQNIISMFVDSIPQQYSIILNMFFINDMSHDEISKTLNLPLGTVKNRIFRAKEALKKLILKHYKEEELEGYLA
ncbi:MAG: sigma-70 family RNA polymerase sigma factor [Bacteroidetes bacterium]|nr:sigma-70 family RNA polymerase sigma factor [Bacteroidota bacterium]